MNKKLYSKSKQRHGNDKYITRKYNDGQTEIVKITGYYQLGVMPSASVVNHVPNGARRIKWGM